MDLILKRGGFKRKIIKEDEIISFVKYINEKNIFILEDMK